MMKIQRIQAKEKENVELVSDELPDPEDGEVQVRTEFSLVSPGTERALITELPNTSGDYPRMLGYSASGIVIKTGNGVTKFKVNDRVAGVINHQSAANISEKKLVHVPEGLTLEQAAFLFLGVITLQGVRKARIELGESCLVIGQGLIGQITAQLAQANGAYPVICTDKVKSKLKLAKKNGIDAVIDANSPDWLQNVLAATNGQGANIVMESTGFPAPVNDAFAGAAQYGRVILLASTRGITTEVNFYRDVHRKGLYVIGAHVLCNPVYESRPGHWTIQDDANVFLNMIKIGKVKVNNLINECRSYKDYKEIYSRVINWEKDYITSLINWQEK